MKKKNLLLAALALTALAGCSDDTFVGDQSLQGSIGTNGAISFNMKTPAITRADKEGSAAATDLSNQFVVYGEKSETDDGVAAAAGKLVFKNYLVKWTDNSAYTTTSNTKNWEYVGISATSAENTNISPNSGTDAQTIKYWDYSASNYVFTAVSALPADIQNGRVKIEKITDASSTTSNKVFNKGYIIKFDKTGDATYASFDKLYFSDRQVISQGTGTDRTATNAYGGNATLTFRNALSQVRVGIYETISGYSISGIHFFVTGDNEAKVDAVDAFGAICPNIKSSTYTEALKVTYEPSGTVENHPIVTPVTKANTETAVTPTTDLILGTNTSLVTPAAPLGTTTTSPTWDTSGGTFTPVFPQAENPTNLKLKCNYTLYNSISGETINVTGATAEIPSQYLQWKPNFKYTYLFKISENTNGTTGGSVVGLYPITFDAIEVIAEDGNVEYITTVSEPSITTFGVKDSKYVTGGSDYAAGTVVYATVMDGSSLATLEASNMKLYTVTGSGDLTEAGVAEALIEKPTMTKAQVDLAKVIPAASSFTDYTKTVPAENGTTITLDGSNNKAAYFTTVTDTKYAIVYENTPATYVWGTGTKYASSDAFNAAKSAAVDGKLYTDDQCTTEASWADGDTYYYTANAAKYSTNELFTAAGNVFAAPGSVATPAASRTSDTTPYYKPIKVKSMGKYAVKVVTCP